MKKLTYIFLFSFLFSCITPQKYFENKDYDKAYKTALKELKSNKSVEENRPVLIGSLEKIIEREYARINTLENSEKTESWNKGLTQLGKLKEKINGSASYTDGFFDKQHQALTKREDKLVDRLFMFFKNRGLEQYKKYDDSKKKILAQYAHQDFIKAKKYKNEGVALDTLIKQSYSNAIVNIYVESNTRGFISKSWNIDWTFDDIEGYGGEYTRISYEMNLDDIDCYMEINFDRIDFDTDEDDSSQDFEKKVIKEYETVTDTAGNESEIPVYETVEGEVVIVTKTKTATWEVEVNINSHTQNCGMSSSRFTANRVSEIREIKTRGDERAIPAEYLNAEEQEFEDEDDMMEEMLEELYEQITGYYF